MFWGGGRSQNCHSHHITCRECPSTRLGTTDANLDHLLEIVAARFPYYKLTSFPHFLQLYYLEENFMYNFYLRDRELC